jgi:RNA polymerase sigma-70 factor (ECF subfamily)
MHTIHQEAAFRFVMAHRTMLKAYVTAIVHDPILAEDTFSDVTLQIVRSWENFDQSKPFPPWARGLARRVALANLRREGRRPLVLEDSVLEDVAEQLDQAGSESQLEEYKEALHRCLDRLPERNRRLIRLRYFENHSYQAMSQSVNKSVGALYVIFCRLHQILSRCVHRESRSL